LPLKNKTNQLFLLFICCRIGRSRIEKEKMREKERKVREKQKKSKKKNEKKMKK
jgi:hypothetical protein